MPVYAVVVFFYSNWLQSPALAWAAHAFAGLGSIDGPVGLAHDVQAAGLEELALEPVQLGRHVRTAVQVAIRLAAAPHHEAGRGLAVHLDREAHAHAAFRHLRRSADEDALG